MTPSEHSVLLGESSSRPSLDAAPATGPANADRKPALVQRTESLALNTERDDALDIVKGVCVLVMVLYHTVGYFKESPLDNKFLAFVTGSFILLAGFVVTSVYLRRYGPRGQWRKLLSRVLVRGAKLIVIAVVLNLVTTQVLRGIKPSTGGVAHMLYNLLLGIDYHAVSFDLLLLIGYTLILIGLLLVLFHSRLVLALAAVVSVIYASVATGFQWQGNYYCRFVAIGLVGAALGLASHDKVVMFCSKRSLVFLLFLAQYFAMILFNRTYLIYLAHVLGTVLLIYSIALICDPRDAIWRNVIMLGKYSLLSYVFQIVLLQGLRQFWYPTGPWVMITFVMASVATLGCVVLTDELRRRLNIFDHGYRLIFC